MSSEAAPSGAESTQVNYEQVYAVTDRLIAAGIGFGVYSGSQAILLAGHRPLNDVDIWFDYAKIDQLLGTFPEAEFLDRRDAGPDSAYDGVVVNLGEGDKVQAMSGTFTYAGGVRYPLQWDEQVERHARFQNLGGLYTYFVDPVETVVFKAISQRGEEQGKHDISDIVAIAGHIDIDMEYLFWRIHSSQSWRRVVPLLSRLGVITPEDIQRYGLPHET